MSFSVLHFSGIYGRWAQVYKHKGPWLHKNSPWLEWSTATTTTWTSTNDALATSLHLSNSKSNQMHVCCTVSVVKRWNGFSMTILTFYYLTSSRKGHSKVRNLFRDIHCSSFSYQFKWKLEAMKGWIVGQFYQSWHDSTLEKECSRCVLSFAQASSAYYRVILRKGGYEIMFRYIPCEMLSQEPRLMQNVKS